MTNEGGWVPVALSAAVEAGTSAGAVVDGAEIVVWRDDKGKAHVWEDRCPHRGMRMSFGFVRGDHIACLYHGWAYNATGQCRYIPAHPDLDVPKTIKIPAYAAEERGGIIWTALAADADPAGIADFGMASLPLRSLYVDCPLRQVFTALENTRLPAASGEEVPVALEKRAPAAWLLKAGATRLAIAAQTITARKTALHITIDESSAALRPALARWAEMLRNNLEKTAAENTVMPEVA